ncbi:helix-turn-helix domain-containing protein [Alteribacter lacisalsi]|nr:helix-turn-helix domain-containing protein [Alteribacter lacisalsi]
MIGQKIFCRRKQKGLTQEQLAHGICSISHLSKIENGHELPGADILAHLCKRLGTSSADILRDDTEVLFQSLYKWYASVNNRDETKAAELAGIIRRQAESTHDSEALLYWKLFRVWYLLYLRKTEEAGSLLEEICPYRERLQTKAGYFFHLFSGFYHCLTEDYLQALGHLLDAEERMEESGGSDPELYYQMALVNMNLHRTYYSIESAGKAADHYTKELNYIRTIDCEILLSVNKARLKQFAQAEKHLNHAREASSLLSSDMHAAVIYHNYGYLKYCQGEVLDSLPFFIKSKHLGESRQYEERIRTAYCLGRAYYELKNFETAGRWISQGKEMAIRHGLNEFYLHFKVLAFRNTGSLDLDYEMLLKNEVIPYFTEKQLWHHAANYAELLAEYYASANRYKWSAHYFSFVNKSREKIYEWTPC